MLACECLHQVQDAVMTVMHAVKLCIRTVFHEAP